MIRGIVELPLRVTPQPAQHINPTGDCGACCLSGLLGLPVAEVYDRYFPSRCAFSWPTLRDALYQIEADGWFDGLVDDIPLWPMNDAALPFGHTAWGNAHAWSRYIRMAMQAGYYPLMAIRFAPGGNFNDITHRDVNHFVFAVQHKIVWPTGPGAIEDYLTISDSARPEWEIKPQDFLVQHGGYNALLVKMKRRP